MHCTRKVKDDIYWIGGNNRRLALFENTYPISRGTSFNSYFIDDEKTTLVDTVDKSISEQFMDNLEYVLKGRNLDYLIVHHMEPDHCSMIEHVVIKYPSVKIIGSNKTITMIKQYFNFDIESRAIIVKEGDYISTGKHNLLFLEAPMVHWPEVLISYDVTDKILFSADAFGAFGALNGNIFNDEMDLEHELLDEIRRYYTNIVGKFGSQVMSVLKKASAIDINMICPLHGPIWRSNISWLFEKYTNWATYSPEENGILIIYGSIYGNTENAVDILACKLADLGIKNIQLYDVSNTHSSYVISDCFKYSNLVLASPTFNGSLFTKMHDLLLDLKAHNLQNRKVAIIENGSWAPNSAKKIKEILSDMKNMTILENTITIKSSVKENQLLEIEKLAEKLALL